MATRQKKKQKRRERVSAKRRVDDHAVGGGSNYLQVPDGYSFMTVKAKKYRLDFRSYKVGKGNPFADEGDLHYERTFWVHRDIGPNKEWHLCAAKTLNQPCPVCEYRAKLAKDPNSDEGMIKDLAPKERQLWLPVDLGADDDEKLIWEFSYHLFGKQLDKKIKSGDDEDEYEFFADPEDGLTLRVVFDQSEHGKWVEASDIEFKKRHDQYDAEDCDGLPCLDDLLVATPYEKLKALFLQTDEADDDDDDDEKPKRRKSKPKSKPKKEPEPEPEPEEDEDDDDDVPFDEEDDPEDDDPEDDDPDDDEPLTAEDAGLEEGDTVTYESGSVEIVRISGDGTSLTLVDDEGDQFKGVGCDEVEKVKPKKKPKKGKPEKKNPEKKGKPKKGKPKKGKPKKGKSKDGDTDDEEEEEWDNDW